MTLPAAEAYKAGADDDILFSNLFQSACCIVLSSPLILQSSEEARGCHHTAPSKHWLGGYYIRDDNDNHNKIRKYYKHFACRRFNASSVSWITLASADLAAFLPIY
jgi:hypothetical protein